MRRGTIVLLILSSLLSGCFVPVPVGPGPGRHYHHHDWR
jgi:hypothetical protein